MTPPKTSLHEDFGFKDTEKLFMNTAPILNQDAGNRLKWARMSKLLTQRQLGEILGLSQDTVSTLETKGSVGLRPITMKMFVDTFGVEMCKWILWGHRNQAFESQTHMAWKKYWAAKHKPKGNRIPFYARDTEQSMTFKKNTLKAELEELETQIRNKRGGKV